MITVGLDFGTHQTKVCVERKESMELEYSFFEFADTEGNKHYTLPSIIGENADGRLAYGYIDAKKYKDIKRYFKQATFNTGVPESSKLDAMRQSVWYIAYILFDLEEAFGQDFTIQMGVPTDGSHFIHKKHFAARILASAYYLVEDVFQNDKDEFLATPEKDLIVWTEIPDYSEALKEEYQFLFFPEAYACLMPLVSSAKIATGMSLMIDIGGGTTDISFFTIKNNRPQVYDFFSINKGLNYLTNADHRQEDHRASSNIKTSSEISPRMSQTYVNDVNTVCFRLIQKLKDEFRRQTSLRVERLMDALKARPIIYTGGGSTFAMLRKSYGGFKDVIHISDEQWKTEAVDDMVRIKSYGMCPILSTAYGLSISVPDDDIRCESFQDIFENIRGAEENHQVEREYVYGRSICSSGFDYGTDWDALK